MDCNYQLSQYVSDYDAMRKIVFNSENEVEDVRSVHDGKSMDITYKKKDACRSPNSRGNLIVGIFTTAQAQLILLKVLEVVGFRILYCDTDSVSYVHREGLPEPKIGRVIGELTDDLGGRTITSFTALGKKTYACVLSDGEVKIRAKGIPRTEKLKDYLNASVFEDLVHGRGPYTVVGCDATTFKRNPKDYTIRTAQLKRRVACTFTSRVIGRDFITYPHGYANIDFPSVHDPEGPLILNLAVRFDLIEEPTDLEDLEEAIENVFESEE